MRRGGYRYRQRIRRKNYGEYMRIVLAGNPNAGKSTLFNSLTGESRRVGNWHGVTVDEGEGSFNLGGKRVSLVDLPGLYTVRGSENEESVAEKFLVKGDYDIIVIVTEAKTVKRTARLVREIKAYGKPVILFVNLVKEFEKRGGKIFADKLSSSLGVPVFTGEAIDKTDVEKFKARLLSVESPRKGDGNEDYVVYPKTNADGIKYNPIFGCSCFLVAVFLTFYLAFGRYSPATYAGRFFTDYLGVKLTKMLITALSGRVSPFILGLITEGIIGGTFSFLRAGLLRRRFKQGRFGRQGDLYAYERLRLYRARRGFFFVDRRRRNKKENDTLPAVRKLLGAYPRVFVYRRQSL